MKKTLSAALLAGCLFTSAEAANFDIGISGSERGISGFAFSIGDYYRIPSRDVIVIERRIPRDELSVVYLLSNRSHRSASFIADLRLAGHSWWDITLRLGLDPYTIYTVDSRRHSGPPYGKAYGYYKEGKKHRLRDDEIIELSNTRFLSKYHRVSADDVIDRRRGGEHFWSIDDHYRMKKSDISQNESRRENIAPRQRSEGKNQHPGNRDKGGPGDRGNQGPGKGNNR